MLQWILRFGVLLTMVLGAASASAQSLKDLRATAATQFRAKAFDNALATHRLIDQRLSAGEFPEQRALNRYRIARCLDELGRQRDAALMLIEVLSSLRKVNQGRARRRLENLRRHKLGRIVARCYRAGVRVTIEGVEPVAQRCGTEWDLLEPGEYTLFWRGGGGLRRVTRVQVRAGRLTRARLRLAPTPAVSDTVRWSLAGGAIAALALGGAFYSLGLDAIEDGDEAEQRFRAARGQEARRQALDDTRAADDELGTWRALTYTFVGTGLALAGGAAWAFFATSQAGSPQAAVVPQVGPGWVGATFHF